VRHVPGLAGCSKREQGVGKIHERAIAEIMNRVRLLAKDATGEATQHTSGAYFDEGTCAFGV
jgi:hypothetical protein